MSYLVLARKWRPKTFGEMVGQEHVLRALINALDHERLHHAYLFTGTRGVGKTTIARIFAKSLNCEQGIGSSPCGVCSTCREIDEGRFVDLLEIDAASRTKVEDTRDLLENVQYAPTRGRYKVYLIDEVHMLSKHSFNALLKTLEEPPPHVKFLLATTDPQRLPMTILSRCLQFSLKRLPLEAIGGHLSYILGHEGIEAEPAALHLLARAADGSMRDGLSLLDQAIAYGGGRVLESEVRDMLGTIDQRHVVDLLDQLAAGSGEGVLAAVARAAEHAVDFNEMLAALISALHRIALAQTVPGALVDDEVDREAVMALAERIGPEDVQLYYQIGLIGRRDLPLAPDPRSGFEMVVLRMLAFRPEPVTAPPRETVGRREAGARQTPAVKAEEAVRPPAPAPSSGVGEDWAAVVEALGLSGMGKAFVTHTRLLSRDGQHIRLVLDAAHGHLRNEALERRIEAALQRHFGQPLKMEIVVGSAEGETPAEQRSRAEQARKQAALSAIESDKEVQLIQEVFNARVIPDSVQPVE